MKSQKSKIIKIIKITKIIQDFMNIILCNIFYNCDRAREREYTYKIYNLVRLYRNII